MVNSGEKSFVLSFSKLINIFLQKNACHGHVAKTLIGNVYFGWSPAYPSKIYDLSLIFFEL